jgi:hypothetical protein
MARWAGWGAGPAGAGAAGPSRVFLAIALAACVVIALAMFVQEKYLAGAVATAGSAYFVARLRGLGRAE